MPHFNVSFLYCQVVDYSQIDGPVILFLGDRSLGSSEVDENQSTII